MTEPVSAAEIDGVSAAGGTETVGVAGAARCARAVDGLEDGRRPARGAQAVRPVLPDLVYPGWVVGILACLALYGLFYITVYPVLWLLFWPMRAWMKKNRPEDYAESQRDK